MLIIIFMHKCDFVWWSYYNEGVRSKTLITHKNTLIKDFTPAGLKSETWQVPLLILL